MKKVRQEITDRLNRVPIGANITIFGKNSVTKFWGKVETHWDKIPTHTATFAGDMGKEKDMILEAKMWVEFSPISGYLKKKNVKVVAQWYTDLTLEEKMEIHSRITWFRGRRIFYDIGGYAGFLTRLFPFLQKILKPSDKLFFCSELAATIWEGDFRSAYETIKKWVKIRAWSAKPTPTAAAPIDGYSYHLKNRLCETLVLKEKGEKYYQ